MFKVTTFNLQQTKLLTPRNPKFAPAAVTTSWFGSTLALGSWLVTALKVISKSVCLG